MKRIGVALCVFLLLSAFTSECLVVVKGASQNSSFIITMSVTFSNNGTSIWNLTHEDKAISLFMNNTWQTVQLTNYSHPIEMQEPDNDGNPLAVLRFPESELKPGENMSYTVTYQAISQPRLLPENISEEESGTLTDITEELKRNYTEAEENWLIDDPELKEIAYNITNGETKVLTIVKSLVAWIDDSVEYPEDSHEMPWYANETLTEKEGDCDDQAILLITLCRILGIPAYLQVGCIYLPALAHSRETYWNDHVTVVSKRIGWHGWSMVYIPPWGWLPADLTYVTAPSGLSNPLNAIKGAAITMPTVIQYMNVSKTDYVASSRRYKKFLQEHDFYIYEQHEIVSTSPTSLWNELLRLLPLVLIATIVPAVSIIILVVYITTRKKNPRTAQPQTS